MKKKIVSLILAMAICLSIVTVLAGCGGDKNDNNNSATAPDAFVIMTEELDGLFNPFYSTTAADGTIVSMTQIGMLTTTLDDKGNVIEAYGDGHAVVTKDYKSEYSASDNTTTYTFVIKNGIKFSDGEALTIEDVLFNMYVYLDPVYTGSSTMYSTDIVGLKDYRTQTSGALDSTDDVISETATARAKTRINELINLYKAKGDPDNNGTYEVAIEDMKQYIREYTVQSGYQSAVSANPSEVTNAQLLLDYEKALGYFKEELGDDYVSAQEAYDLEKAPYNDSKWANYFNNEIFRFMAYEGMVTFEYADKVKDDGTIVPNGDKTVITDITINYSESVCTDKATAIEYVYNSKVSTNLEEILRYWATAQKLQTEYAAQAKEVILIENMRANGDEDGLLIPNISGIVSLGHTTTTETVTIGNNVYNVAHEHNTDGTPKNENEFDVLQITINGVDPKAVWNFAFSVAPQHYYAKNYTVDIANNQFGVKFGSFSFMTDEIQSTQNIKIPVGAGAYKATNSANSDTPGITEFFSDNVVYFKANDNFMFDVNIDKIRYQVVSSSNALNALTTGTVHYATPQLTDNNINTLDANKSKGIEYTYTDQLGYGYIGINAGKVPNINLRRAIMSAMNTSLAIEYYRINTASTIYWPMSTVSWAYPKDANGKPDVDNGCDYIDFTFNDDEAITSIQNYMAAAGVSAGDSKLKIKFTIAGSNLTDHPTYAVFQKAATLLNSCGWDIEVVADTQALTKLSTGSLAVWAAAWGSTIDPDMYQVYHKNSTATSVLAWGYREILASPGEYEEETVILNDLADLIDRARETTDRDDRTDLYKQAMGEVLKLAVEMPVYQRSVLYAYNTNVIDPSSLPETINPYSSPLDRIWEIKFAS